LSKWPVEFNIFIGVWENPFISGIEYRNETSKRDLFHEDYILWAHPELEYERKIEGETFLDLYKSISKIVDKCINGKLGVAIRNFLKGSISNFESSFFFYLISLEASLLYDTKEEIVEKFSRNLAILLGHDSRNMERFRKFGKKLYNTRSRLVHGDFKPLNLEEEIKECGKMIGSIDDYNIYINLRCLARYIILFMGTVEVLFEDETFRKELFEQCGIEKPQNKNFKEFYRALDSIIFNHQAIFWLQERVRSHWGKHWAMIDCCSKD
jgi:hypothetical protein